MARHNGSVLLDTNAILELHRVGSWRALIGGYRVETVEDCVTETQTGFQRRQPERQIDLGKLRASLSAVHLVENSERARLAVRVPDIFLDLGENSLWAHALARSDAWVLCGPDKASLRCGIRLGFHERLVSLEGLLNDIGHQPKTHLQRAYTRKWHRQTIGQLVMDESGGF